MGNLSLSLWGNCGVPQPVAWASLFGSIVGLWWGPLSNHIAPALAVAVSAGLPRCPQPSRDWEVSSSAYLPVPTHPRLLHAQPVIRLSVWSFWMLRTLALYLLGFYLTHNSSSLHSQDSSMTHWLGHRKKEAWSVTSLTLFSIATHSSLIYHRLTFPKLG